MSIITNDKIESGTDVCPSCKSDNWKSAKMVVMEGTTNTTGRLDGAMKSPGKLSGGMKEFLLSDRWFTWDYPIEAKVGLSSSTGLVEEVKRLMVHHSPQIQMPFPIPPKAPENDIGFFERVKLTPVEPQKPTLPEKPENTTEEEKDKIEERAKSFSKSYDKFLTILVFSVYILFVLVKEPLGYIGIYGFKAFAGYLVGLFLVMLFLKIMTNDKTQSDIKYDDLTLDGLTVYEYKLKEYEKASKRYQLLLEKYNSDILRYESDFKKMASRESEVEQAKALYEKNFTEHEKKLAEYETEKIKVVKARELLWEQARICMRCGTAYLGND